jgi:hypothetical protein
MINHEKNTITMHNLTPVRENNQREEIFRGFKKWRKRK